MIFFLKQITNNTLINQHRKTVSPLRVMPSLNYNPNASALCKQRRIFVYVLIKLTGPAGRLRDNQKLNSFTFDEGPNLLFELLYTRDEWVLNVEARGLSGILHVQILTNISGSQSLNFECVNCNFKQGWLAFPKQVQSGFLCRTPPHLEYYYLVE
jgi:hypothetical protein